MLTQLDCFLKVLWSGEDFISAYLVLGVRAPYKLSAVIRQSQYLLTLVSGVR